MRQLFKIVQHTNAYGVMPRPSFSAPRSVPIPNAPDAQRGIATTEDANANIGVAQQGYGLCIKALNELYGIVWKKASARPIEPITHEKPIGDVLHNLLQKRIDEANVNSPGLYVDNFSAAIRNELNKFKLGTDRQESSVATLFDLFVHLASIGNYNYYEQKRREYGMVRWLDDIVIDDALSQWPFDSSACHKGYGPEVLLRLLRLMHKDLRQANDVPEYTKSRAYRCLHDHEYTTHNHGGARYIDAVEGAHTDQSISAAVMHHAEKYAIDIIDATKRSGSISALQKQAPLYDWTSETWKRHKSSPLEQKQAVSWDTPLMESVANFCTPSKEFRDDIVKHAGAPATENIRWASQIHNIEQSLLIKRALAHAALYGLMANGMKRAPFVNRLLALAGLAFTQNFVELVQVLRTVPSRSNGLKAVHDLWFLLTGGGSGYGQPGGHATPFLQFAQLFYLGTEEVFAIDTASGMYGTAVNKNNNLVMSDNFVNAVIQKLKPSRAGIRDNAMRASHFFMSAGTQWAWSGPQFASTMLNKGMKSLVEMVHALDSCMQYIQAAALYNIVNDENALYGLMELENTPIRVSSASALDGSFDMMTSALRAESTAWLIDLLSKLAVQEQTYMWSGQSINVSISRLVSTRVDDLRLLIACVSEHSGAVVGLSGPADMSEDIVLRRTAGACWARIIVVLETLRDKYFNHRQDLGRGSASIVAADIAKDVFWLGALIQMKQAVYNGTTGFSRGFSQVMLQNTKPGVTMKLGAIDMDRLKQVSFATSGPQFYENEFIEWWARGIAHEATAVYESAIDALKDVIQPSNTGNPNFSWDSFMQEFNTSTASYVQIGADMSAVAATATVIGTFVEREYFDAITPRDAWGKVTETVINPTLDALTKNFPGTVVSSVAQNNVTAIEGLDTLYGQAYSTTGGANANSVSNCPVVMAPVAAQFMSTAALAENISAVGKCTSFYMPRREALNAAAVAGKHSVFHGADKYESDNFGIDQTSIHKNIHSVYGQGNASAMQTDAIEDKSIAAGIVTEVNSDMTLWYGRLSNTSTNNTTTNGGYMHNYASGNGLLACRVLDVERVVASSTRRKQLVPLLGSALKKHWAMFGSAPLAHSKEMECSTMFWSLVHLCCNDPNMCTTYKRQTEPPSNIYNDQRNCMCHFAKKGDVYFQGDILYLCPSNAVMAEVLPLIKTRHQLAFFMMMHMLRRPSPEMLDAPFMNDGGKWYKQRKMMVMGPYGLMFNALKLIQLGYVSQQDHDAYRAVAQCCGVVHTRAMINPLALLFDACVDEANKVSVY